MKRTILKYDEARRFFELGKIKEAASILNSILLLVRIKKAINLPSHLLEVSFYEVNPALINKGIHFITDYREYQTSLIQAKALLSAGE